MGGGYVIKNGTFYYLLPAESRGMEQGGMEERNTQGAVAAGQQQKCMYVSRVWPLHTKCIL